VVSQLNRRQVQIIGIVRPGNAETWTLAVETKRAGTLRKPALPRQFRQGRPGVFLGHASDGWQKTGRTIRQEKFRGGLHGTLFHIGKKMLAHTVLQQIDHARIEVVALPVDPLPALGIGLASLDKSGDPIARDQ